jgi:hypothetical protein
MDLVWLRESDVRKADLSINADEGETPAKHLARNHRHLVGVDLVRLARLSRNISRAIAHDQARRFTQDEIRKLLLGAVTNGFIAATDLNSDITQKLRRDEQK